jgi:hypothetical protein
MQGIVGLCAGYSQFIICRLQSVYMWGMVRKYMQGIVSVYEGYSQTLPVYMQAVVDIHSIHPLCTFSDTGKM